MDLRILGESGDKPIRTWENHRRTTAIGEWRYILWEFVKIAFEAMASERLRVYLFLFDIFATFRNDRICAPTAVGYRLQFADGLLK